jgi:hypothetical protein
MHDDIRQMVAQLEKNGVGVVVGCDHIAWRVSTVDGDQMLCCNSSREVLMFLSGILFAKAMTCQAVT